MKLEEGREIIEAELMYGARKLARAKRGGTRVEAEHWRTYVADRERFLVILDSMYEEEAL